MSTPRAQLNNDGTAEMVEPQEFPGYYVVNGNKVDPDGNPWKGKVAKAAPAEEPVVEEKAPAKGDPITGKK